MKTEVLWQKEKDILKNSFSYIGLCNEYFDTELKIFFLLVSKFTIALSLKTTKKIHKKGVFIKYDFKIPQSTLLL